ncbi:MAG: hypothetical protein IPJ84_05325 [Bdellovibrionales bacterium]|nr:hypothetical protein [Bdellovibrionales bacterium]
MVQVFGFALAVTMLVAQPFAQAQDTPIEVIKTFDGRVMRCEEKVDVGTVAYALRSPTGTIKGDQFEVAVELETYACVEKQGAMVLEAMPLTGRFVNVLGGYVEFKNLEFVVYSPDFKVVQPVALDQKASKQNAVVSVPVAALDSLSAEAVARAGERKVVLIGFMRGIAETGDTKTGKVFDSGLLGFGEFNFLLSETKGTLK